MNALANQTQIDNTQVFLELVSTPNVDAVEQQLEKLHLVDRFGTPNFNTLNFLFDLAN